MKDAKKCNEFFGGNCGKREKNFISYDLANLAMAAIPYSIAVAIGELIVWLSDKRKDSRLAKQSAENIESNGDV